MSQSSGFQKISKVSEITTKPNYAGLNIIVGPHDTRTSNVPRDRQYAGKNPPGRNPCQVSSRVLG